MKIRYGFIGILVGVIVLLGCAHEEYGIFRGPEHLEYETTGFKADHRINGRLLVRRVQDSRFKYVGTPIAEKKAMLVDSAFHRDMAEEFENALLKELERSGLFREVLLTDEVPSTTDYVMKISDSHF